MTEAEARILRALGDEAPSVQVKALLETDSTNLRLKEWAREGRIKAPFLLTADSQTAGRGRLGRAFVSPARTGLYMSVLTRPPENTDSGKITILAAVAVCRAIEEETGVQAKIKWVNDLFYQGKKVCGILAEGMDQGVIVGIGVNLLPPPGGFPKEAGVAGALNVDADRMALAGAIGRHLLAGLKHIDDPGILAYYRSRMPLIGQTVRFTENGQQKDARVTGVGDDGGLMVEGKDGPRVLRTGEVTLGSQAFSGLE